MLRTITLNKESVEYELEFKKIKNVNVRIRGGVVTPLYVSAPFGTSIALIESFLISNASRILSSLEKIKSVSNANKSAADNNTLDSDREIKLGKRRITYKLTFRKTSRLSVSVKERKGVTVSAPYGTNINDIEDFLIKNTEFILKAVDECAEKEKFSPKPKKYVNGEYIYFLGEKKYVEVRRGVEESAVILGNKIIITVCDTELFERKEKLTDALLTRECKKQVNQVITELYPKFKATGIPYPKEIRFKKMVSCWGNCRSDRRILTFNMHLVQLPRECIEMVVCHEFTHFLHNNHSKSFYNQLSKFMPSWKDCELTINNLQREIIIRE